jgi:type II secretion system protein G
MKRIFSLWWVIFILSLVLAFAFVAVRPIVDLKITKAQDDLSSLQTALETYRTQRGALPSEQESLGALVGPVLARVPTDPWGNPYVYRRTGWSDTYRVYSRGLDGRDDGGGGDDVTTTAKTYRCADYGVNCPPTVRDLTVYASLFLAAGSLLVGLGTGLLPWFAPPLKSDAKH